MSRLFISHSSKNDEWAIALKDWLVREGWSGPDDIFLDLDPERGIAAGQRWAHALEDAATRCEAVLFLVSEDWLASKWCSDEYQLANRLNKKLFALLVDDVAPDRLPGGLMAQWQIVRLKGEPAERFLAVHPLTQRQLPVHLAEAGLKSLKRGLAKAGIGAETFELQADQHGPFGWRAPYRGLEALEPEDAAVFFGRNADIVRGIDMLRGLAARKPPRLLVILGASGAGKSSFLRAGLWPRLLRDDAQWLPLGIIRAGRGGAIEGNEGLLAALEDVHRRFALPATRAALRERLGTPDSFIALLRELRQAAAKRALISALPYPLPVLCLDQGEEVFAASAQRESERFIALARAAIDHDEALLLVSIRSDSYGAMQDAKALAGVDQVPLSLGPVPHGEIAQIIRGPAEILRSKAGSVAPLFDAAVIERLQQEIEGEDDALPLLAFVLQRLMREHQGMPVIGVVELERSGGVSAAIESAAEAALDDAGIGRDRAVQRDALRRLFIPRLARIRRDSKTPQRHVAPQSEVPTDLLPLARALTERRLLVVKTRGQLESGIIADTATLEVAHEALLRRWPTLAGLLDEDRDALLLLDGVLLAATDWEKADAQRRPDYLYHRGSRLADALTLTARGSDWEREIRPARAYLAACQAREEAERAAEAARIEREKEQIAATRAAQAERETALREREAAQQREAQASRRVVRRTAAGLVAALILAAIAGGFGYYAYLKRGEAEDQRAGAVASEQRAIAAQAAALKSRDEALLTQSKFLAEAAMQAIDRREPVTAALLALEALPDQSSEDEIKRTRPYWAPAEIPLEAGLRLIREERVINGHRITVQSVAMTPDGSRIVSGSYNEVHIWNGATGAEIIRLKGEVGAIHGVAITADGSRVVTGGSSNNAVVVWDASTGERIVEIPGDSVRAFAITPDGSRIVAGSGNWVRVWDGRTGKELAVMRGHSDQVYGVAITPDGSRVASASYDRTARVWDSATGESIAVLQGHEGGVGCVGVTADGSRVFTGSWDHTVRVWDGNTGAQLAILRGHQATVTGIAIIGDGERIISSAADATARIWDTVAGKELAVLKGHESAIWGVAVTRDGSRIVTGSGQEIADGKRSDNTVRIWSGKIGPDLMTLAGHSGTLNAVAISRDARRIVTGSDDKTARVWDAASGALIAVLAGHAAAITRVAFTPDGKRVVTTGRDKTARIWDADAGHELLVLNGHADDIWGLAITSDGAAVLTGSLDKTLRVWDINTGAALATFPHNGRIWNLALLPDDKRVVTGSDDAARVIDLASGAELMVLKGHTNSIQAVAITPDGTRILTGSLDETARIWDAATGAEVGRLAGITDQVKGLAVTSDGGRILSASENQYYPLTFASVWDFKSFAEIARLNGHSSNVTAVVVTPDRRRAVTGSWDKTARVWELFEPGQALIERAKERVPRCLSLEERQKYFLAPEPPSWCSTSQKFPYDRRSLGKRLIERGDNEIQNKDYQAASATFGKAIEVLDQSNPDLLGDAYFGRGRATDRLQKYSEAIVYFRKAQELGQGDAGNWLWWSTKRLSEQKLADGSAAEALLISMHNFLELTPTVRKTIEPDDLRTQSRSIAYPLGVLHGDVAAARAAAATDCDRLATQGYDPLRVAPGIALTQIDATAALAACSTAIERDGKQGRFLLQRSRAHAKAAADAQNVKDGATASAHIRAEFDDLTAAMALDYPYAFNNTALMYENGESVTKDPAKSAALSAEFANRIIECCTARVVRRLMEVGAQHDKAIVDEVTGALLGWAAELGSVPAHETLASLALEHRLTPPQGIDPRVIALMHYRVAAELSAAAGDSVKARELGALADTTTRALSTAEAAEAESRARAFTKAGITASPPWLQ